MALFGSFGNILQGSLGIIGQAYSGTAVGSFGQLGSSVLGAALQQPVASGPVVQTSAPSAGTVMRAASGAVISGIGRAATRLAVPILIKIAEKLGRKTLTLRQAIAMIRKMGKFITDPATIAIALGISVAELAQLITAHSNQPVRRMNPANVKALRRSMRRISSFHRLCVKADTLRGGRRRRPARGSCPPGVQVVRGG